MKNRPSKERQVFNLSKALKGRFLKLFFMAMKKKSSAGSIMTLLGCQVNTGQIQENRGDIALPAF